MAKHYIDKEKFIEEIKKCKKTGIISEELGEIFILMAENIAYMRNFINYSEEWKQEMISDAIYNCVRYVKKFDFNRSDNPFAYFTTVCVNAFIFRIKKEKGKNFKDSEIKKELYDEFVEEYRLNRSNYDTEDLDFEGNSCNDDIYFKETSNVNEESEESKERIKTS